MMQEERGKKIHLLLTKQTLTNLNILNQSSSRNLQENMNLKLSLLSFQQNQGLNRLIQEKTIEEENEELIVFLKANGFQSRKFKNMKVKTLRNHAKAASSTNEEEWEILKHTYIVDVEETNKSIDLDQTQSKVMYEEEEMNELKDYIVKNKLPVGYLYVNNFEKLRRQVNRHKSYITQLDQDVKATLAERQDQSLKGEPSNHVLSESKRKTSEEAKQIMAKKKKLSSTEGTGIVDSFESGLENFPKAVLKEKIISWIENFRSINRPSKKMKAVLVEGEGSNRRQVAIRVDSLIVFGSPMPSSQAITSNVVLPQHNSSSKRNTGSLQPFTRFYYDSNTTKAVVKSGSERTIRVYIPQDQRTLSIEDILALHAMNFISLHKDWMDAKYFFKGD
ncbi:hypothetical protein L1987_12843 [Smallanthus sonchifolius]|uniref:Uncharacterized protein n=1 Tax=Smallanthus sonchifolius TaxID=185202 RepID=A0ACB9JFT7_9ASTR|nr:hypothetical protein L1987_12843 [Smallanthus sonchifolius]